MPPVIGHSFCELRSSPRPDAASAAYVAEEHHRQCRMATLREACSGFDQALTVFGIQSDLETWWEVNTSHISGPPIPPPPPPRSDAQLLAPLLRQTQNHVSKSVFGISGGAITEVTLNGACTTDATIDLLRGISNLKELLRCLRKVSLRTTLVTE